MSNPNPPSQTTYLGDDSDEFIDCKNCHRPFMEHGLFPIRTDLNLSCPQESKIQTPTIPTPSQTYVTPQQRAQRLYDPNWFRGTEEQFILVAAAEIQAAEDAALEAAAQRLDAERAGHKWGEVGKYVITRMASMVRTLKSEKKKTSTFFRCIDCGAPPNSHRGGCSYWLDNDNAFPGETLR